MNYKNYNKEPKRIKSLKSALATFINEPDEKNTDALIFSLLRYIVSEVNRHCSFKFILENEISADAIFCTYGMHIGTQNILDYIQYGDYQKIINEIEFIISLESDRLQNSNLKDI